MPKLQNCTCYLAGPITYTSDYRSWREEFKQLIKNDNINLIVEDPIQKPDGLIQEEETLQREVKLLVEQEHWERLCVLMKKVVRTDLRMIDKADFVVAKIDRMTPTFGTMHEIAIASQQRKPVLLITEGGKKNVPPWLFGFLRTNEMFDSVKQCVEYLKQINEQTINIDDRWVLIDLLNQKATT